MTSEAVTWEVDIHEANVLNSNDRPGHWSERSGPTQVVRTLGRAQSKRLGRYERVRVGVEVSYPDRRIRDAQNLYNTMKAYVDGLVDGGKGILPDDNDLFVSGPHLDWSGKMSGRPGWFRFRVTLTPLPALAVDKAALAPSLWKKHFAQ